jgi:hypothetical protein
MPTADYEIPRWGTDPKRILNWCLEAVAEGQQWLQAQQPASNWEGVRQMLSAADGAERDLEGLSNTGYNKGKRIARELVATLANFRHAGEFKPRWSKDKGEYDRAHTLSNLDANWTEETFSHEVIRGALQIAVGFGTSYLVEEWDPHYTRVMGDIKLEAYEAGDVTFVQLPKNHDIQRAYAVIIRKELPINLAKVLYMGTNPAFAANLVPDREQAGWLSKGLRKVQQFVSPALRVAGRMGNQSQQGSFPTVDVYHMYVLDRSMNDGPIPVDMGAPGTNWSYKVPALGDPIRTGTLNRATGQPFTRPASYDDCALFPLRRMLIFSKTGICYDGTSPWWHGQAPVARIRFNDWAWEALGASLVGEVRTMQQGIEALMRMIEDAAAARLDPPAMYDDQLVASSWAKMFNPRKAGARAAANLQLGDPIKYPFPAEYYNVPQWITDWIASQEERMDYIAAVKDLVAIAKAKQIPGADTLEKLMEMAGPIAQDMVRALERPLTQLGEWRKSYYFQFYTRQRMITVTGPDGLVNEKVDIEYLPTHLLPMQQRDEVNTVPILKKSIDDFKYVVSESGINEIHRMTTKLFYIQLMKAGFPISWWTFAKIAQIPNFGPPPEGTNTEMERWIAQKRIETELQIEQAQEVAGSGLLGPDGQPVSSGGGPGGGGAGGGGGEPGRPASFNKAPHIEQKDGGTRSTIATS